MPHRPDPHRRNALVWLLALVALLTAGSASAAGSLLGSTRVGGAATASTDPVVGQFLGAPQGARIGVVVIADAPAAAGQARRITMYVSNGTSISTLLTGNTTGNAAALQSADNRFGAKLTLAPLFASGSFVVSGGGSGFDFKLSRAASFAALYELSITSTGRVIGASSTGASLTGQLSLNSRLITSGKIVATVHASGKDVKLKASARRLTPGAYRWIVLPDGTVFGANKRGLSFGGVGKLVPQSTGDKVARISGGSAGQPGYDDKKCQGLANQVNQLRAIEARSTKSGDTATANQAHDAKAGVIAELEDHCVVIE